MKIDLREYQFFSCIRMCDDLLLEIVLGDRLTVGQMALDHPVGVRIPVSQPHLSATSENPGIKACDRDKSGKIQGKIIYVMVLDSL